MNPLSDMLKLEQFAMTRTNGNLEQTRAAGDVSGLEAMLDYAIVEGAQMRLPLFVCLLRLARMALKEETEDHTMPRKREAHS
jgi:hypothetical protein